VEFPGELNPMDTVRVGGVGLEVAVGVGVRVAVGEGVHVLVGVLVLVGTAVGGEVDVCVGVGWEIVTIAPVIGKPLKLTFP
jgi:hypothetical protein